MRAGRSSGGHRCTAGLAALAACDLDSILDVEDPNKATQEDIEDPNNLPGVRAHAVGEFQVGYAGRGEAQDNAFVLMSGLLADEYEASGTFPTRVEVDRRDILTTNSTAQGTFRLMHRARAAALLSYEAHELHEPGTRLQSEAAMLAGFMYNAFGEMYCSGVPFSRLPLGEDPVYGEPLTMPEMCQTAIEWFDNATAIAGPAAAVLEEQGAAVGRARALLNVGDAAGAAAEVPAVPTEFVLVVNHDEATERQWNGVWTTSWTCTSRSARTGSGRPVTGSVT